MELKTQLSIPKFSFQQTVDLVDAMKAAGISDLFSEVRDIL